MSQQLTLHNKSTISGPFFAMLGLKMNFIVTDFHFLTRNCDPRMMKLTRQ